jgi:hypothetical protein
LLSKLRTRRAREGTEERRFRGTAQADGAEALVAMVSPLTHSWHSCGTKTICRSE